MRLIPSIRAAVSVACSSDCSPGWSVFDNAASERRRGRASLSISTRLPAISSEREGAAGEIAARPRQTLREACLDGIAAYGEENGNVLDRPRRPDGCKAGDDQHDL